MEKTFPIIEIFGPTLQGEGALIGKQTAFVRLGLCDYRCSWCDSMYSVLPEEVAKNATKMTAEEIVQKVKKVARFAPWITLSGGNPAMHDLTQLVAKLKLEGYFIAVETQGSIFKDWFHLCDQITLSPKPPSSGMKTDWIVLNDIIKSLTRGEYNLKVVIFDDRDLAFAREVATRFPYVPLYLQVGNVVGEDSTEALLEKLNWLFEEASKDLKLCNASILPQLHVLMWGNKRGV